MHASSNPRSSSPLDTKTKLDSIICVHIYIHVNTSTYAYPLLTSKERHNHMNINIYTCMYTHACTHTRTRFVDLLSCCLAFAQCSAVDTHARMHVCVCMCMCTPPPTPLSSSYLSAFSRAILGKVKVSPVTYTAGCCDSICRSTCSTSTILTSATAPSNRSIDGVVDAALASAIKSQ